MLFDTVGQLEATKRLVVENFMDFHSQVVIVNLPENFVEFLFHFIDLKFRDSTIFFINFRSHIIVITALVLDQGCFILTISTSIQKFCVNLVESSSLILMEQIWVIHGFDDGGICIVFTVSGNGCSVLLAVFSIFLNFFFPVYSSRVGTFVNCADIPCEIAQIVNIGDIQICQISAVDRVEFAFSLLHVVLQRDDQNWV